MHGDILLSVETETELHSFIDKPSHATLLTGPKGLGTSTMSVLLAANLLGLDSIHLQNAPYYRQINPTNGSISIDQIRRLRQFFQLKVPGDALVKRVVVIDSSETMTGEAQNALLKLLEEPPTGTNIILVSTYPERLLATIRSRVSIFQLIAPSKEQIHSWFINKGNNPADITRAYLMSGGSIKAMIGLLSEGADTSAFDRARSVLGAKTFERLLQVELLSKDKDAANDFVSAMIQIASASLERAANNPQSLKRWQHILAATLSAENDLSRNGNQKLVLTDLLLTI